MSHQITTSTDHWTDDNFIIDVKKINSLFLFCFLSAEWCIAYIKDTLSIYKNWLLGKSQL